MAEKPIINIVDVPLLDRGNGGKFVAKWGPAAPLLGLSKLGCAVHVVPPGKRAFPFHRHHVADELFFIGRSEYRWRNKVFPLRPGDIIAAPSGTESHQIINTGDGEHRYLGISTLGSVNVVDYPDSGKVAVAAGIKNADFSTATFRGMGRIQPADYFDGEA